MANYASGLWVTANAAYHHFETQRLAWDGVQLRYLTLALNGPVQVYRPRTLDRDDNHSLPMVDLESGPHNRRVELASLEMVGHLSYLDKMGRDFFHSSLNVAMMCNEPVEFAHRSVVAGKAPLSSL